MHKPYLFFFPGFAEDGRAFAAMNDILQEKFEIQVVEYRNILQNMDSSTMSIVDFGKEIVRVYGIRQRDILVGHSFGGWTASHIQAITGSPTVCVASFTDPRKVAFRILGFNRFGFWVVKMGLFKTKLFQYIGKRKYRNTPTWGAVAHCFEIMDTWSNEELLKIIRLIAFQPAVYPQSAHLRIHGDQDDTNYLPDEECIVIEGGNHFIQHTHAGFVAQKITNWALGL